MSQNENPAQSASLDAWPEPIRVLLERSEDETQDPVYRHQQKLYALGALLRTAAAALAAQYLVGQSTSDARVDSCLLTDMRRPTYGTLVGFLRACTRSDVDWGPLQPLTTALKSTFERRGHKLPGVHDRTALGGLIAYRNRYAHGASAPDRETCLARLPALQAALEDVLDGVSPLRGARLGTDALTLTPEGEPVSMSPLVHPDGVPCVAIMEGYNSRKGSLHYVSPERTWDSKTDWTRWRALLQRRGLMPVAWDAIDAQSLRRRAAASVPQDAELPEGFVPPPALLERVRLCVEPGRPLMTDDVDLTTALLLCVRSSRACFVAPPPDPGAPSTPMELLTALIGAEESLGELPEGHALESLLEQITLVVPDAQGASWAELAEDFPGLEVIELRRAAEGDGLSYPGSIYPLLLQGLLADSQQTGDALPPQTLAWVDRLDRARVVARVAKASGGANTLPDALWQALVREAAEHHNLSGHELLSASADVPAESPGPAHEALRDLGCARIDSRGKYVLHDEAARAAVIAVAVPGLPSRRRRRLLEALQVRPSPELGVATTGALAEFEFPAGSALWTARVAQLACDDQADLDPLLHDSSSKDVMRVCAALVSWGKPQRVDGLVRRYLASHTRRATTARAEAFEVACAVRSHGSPALAAELFAALADDGDALGVKALHQWAGVLRDRREPGDAERAEQLYARVLASPFASSKQTVWSLCGLAENEYRRRNDEACHAALDRALEVAASPRLRALVEHRRAAAFLYAGNEPSALDAMERAIELLGDALTGAFPARCFNTYAECLYRVGRPADAVPWLTRSLATKRALGDRLGLQKSLILLATLLERSDAAGATNAATEALELATQSADLLGQRAAHARLKRLRRGDADARAWHRDEIARLDTLLAIP